MFQKSELSRGEVVLSVSGSLNGETAGRFQGFLEEMAGGGQRFITLNLKDVDSINSACIGKILLLHRRLAERDRVLRIRGCSEPLYRTFCLIQFDRLLDIEK